MQTRSSAGGSIFSAAGGEEKRGKNLPSVRLRENTTSLFLLQTNLWRRIDMRLVCTAWWISRIAVIASPIQAPHSYSSTPPSLPPLPPQHPILVQFEVLIVWRRGINRGDESRLTPVGARYERPRPCRSPAVRLSLSLRLAMLITLSLPALLPIYCLMARLKDPLKQNDCGSAATTGERNP